ncbi:MAG: alpha/beta hydrolase [Proteobacteria bacterium]|nr:alpha/beta hydrolase [Pseudomonadota bacterium]
MEGRCFFQGAGCQLSAVDFGNPEAPGMVVLHGMRDHGLSMQSIALAFTDYHVIAMDLRGHGDSDNPGSYTMTQLVADLRALVDHFGLIRPILIGHSLGGHVVAKFAAIYADEVDSLVLIDGMGPPQHRDSKTLLDRLQRWREHIANALRTEREPRSMKDKEEAVQRLTKNNPKLKLETARFIVRHGVRDHPHGGIRWKWDARINMVWSTFSHEESEELYSLIACPVQIITGEHSLDYWVQNRGELSGQQELHDRDIERRRRLFPRAEHQVIKGAGHMIHYDQPDRLNAAIRQFLGAGDGAG